MIQIPFFVRSLPFLSRLEKAIIFANKCSTFETGLFQTKIEIRLAIVWFYQIFEFLVIEYLYHGFPIVDYAKVVIDFAGVSGFVELCFKAFHCFFTTILSLDHNTEWCETSSMWTIMAVNMLPINNEFIELNISFVLVTEILDQFGLHILSKLLDLQNVGRPPLK